MTLIMNTVLYFNFWLPYSFSVANNHILFFLRAYPFEWLYTYNQMTGFRQRKLRQLFLPRKEWILWNVKKIYVYFPPKTCLLGMSYSPFLKMSWWCVKGILESVTVPQDLVKLHSQIITSPWMVSRLNLWR